MTPELPPLTLEPPEVRARRRERRGFIAPPAIPAEERRAIAQRWRLQLRGIDAAVRRLSPEAKRAIFLKLNHDRRLTKKDLAGTGLTFFSPPGETESLVVPRDPTKLDKLEERITKFAEGDEPGRPGGTDLATTVQAVDLGNPHDRLSDEVAADYDRLISRDHVIYEIEVASFAISSTRARREVTEIILAVHRSLGRGIHGAVYEQDVQERGARLVLWSTGSKLREFVESDVWWRKIVFFDGRPKFETFSEVYANFNIGDVTVESPAGDAETICVVDTGVSAGNPFLAPVIRTDISRSFVRGFSPTEDAKGHGSGVASLAAYYQVETAIGGVNRAAARIVSARITDDDGQFDVPFTSDDGAHAEREARLLSDVLREIVQHYAPIGIRIFVLSFQIVGHIWSKATRRSVARSAWVARTIDQLSRDYDVVFVTITGNISPAEVTELLGEAEYPHYLLRPLAKLHDPGQAALAVTVGSIAHSSTVAAASLLPIALEMEPSPFTRSGPGFGESNKPDVVERGGNLVRDPASNAVAPNLATNVLMASSRLTPALQHGQGTSFAAPRVAYHLAAVTSDLRSLGVTPTNPLLRALLAASAERSIASEVLDPDGNCMVIGYGLPDGRRATDCGENSVLLYWNGDLGADATALFRLHVPADLRSAGRGKKRIVVSVASQPPVQQWGVEEYLGVTMKFRVFRGDQSFDDIQALLQRDEDEVNAPADKNVQPNELDGLIGISRRSAGTLQRDTFEWSDHKETYSDNDYVIAVSLTPASWMRDSAVPFAVVVRIEDTTGRYQDLYARIRARVQARVRATA